MSVFEGVVVNFKDVDGESGTFSFVSIVHHDISFFKVKRLDSDDLGVRAFALVEGVDGFHFHVEVVLLDLLKAFLLKKNVGTFWARGGKLGRGEN